MPSPHPRQTNDHRAAALEAATETAAELYSEGEDGDLLVTHFITRREFDAYVKSVNAAVEALTKAITPPLR